MSGYFRALTRQIRSDRSVGAAPAGASHREPDALEIHDTRETAPHRAAEPMGHSREVAEAEELPHDVVAPEVRAPAERQGAQTGSRPDASPPTGEANPVIVARVERARGDGYEAEQGHSASHGSDQIRTVPSEPPHTETRPSERSEPLESGTPSVDAAPTGQASPETSPEESPRRSVPERAWRETYQQVVGWVRGDAPTNEAAGERTEPGPRENRSSFDAQGVVIPDAVVVTREPPVAASLEAPETSSTEPAIVVEDRALTLSIGSIHVTVEEPVAPPRPTPRAPPPSPSAASRLRRHYLSPGW